MLRPQAFRHLTLNAFWAVSPTTNPACRTEEAAKKQAEKAEKAEAAKKVKAAFKVNGKMHGHYQSTSAPVHTAAKAVCSPTLVHGLRVCCCVACRPTTPPSTAASRQTTPAWTQLVRCNAHHTSQRVE